MAIFVTGATGYLGSYVVTRLLRAHARAPCAARARQGPCRRRAPAVEGAAAAHGVRRVRSAICASRIELVLGDITELALRPDDARVPAASSRARDSIIHIAASLNRRSERLCFNVNLRGTLEVLQLARAAHEHHGLRRFSDVSTTAVAGEREPRGRAGRQLRSTGSAATTTRTRARRSSASTWSRAAARRADDGVPALDRDRRHALRRDHAVRHGARGAHARAHAGAAAAARRAPRHRARRLRRPRDRRHPPAAGAQAPHLPPERRRWARRRTAR